MNKKSGARTLSVILLVVLILPHFAIHAQELPYKEGDWFEYRFEFLIQNATVSITCRYRVRVQVLKIDLDRHVITVNVSLVEKGEDDKCRELLKGFEDSLPVVEEWNLHDSPGPLRLFVKPTISGTFDCSYGGLECKVVYSRGIAQEMLISQEIIGTRYVLTVKLASTSIWTSDLTVTLAIVVAILVGLGLAILVIVRAIRRYERMAAEEASFPREVSSSYHTRL